MKHAAKRLLSACLALLLVVGLVPAALPPPWQRNRESSPRQARPLPMSTFPPPAEIP